MRSIGYPLSGVQVVNVTEARFVPFQISLILGVVEGFFPKSLPSDFLVDDWMKTQVGLNGWRYIESLEDTTFQNLIQHSQFLHIFFPQKNNNQLTVRSRFVEKIIWDGSAKIIDYQDKQIPNINNVNKNVPIRGNYSSCRQSIMSELSATTANLLLTCRFRFLAHSLGLRSINWWEDNRLQEEGKTLHSIIEHFFLGGNIKSVVFDRLPLQESVQKLKNILIEKINKISTLLFANKKKEYLIWHLKYFSWPRFIDFVIASYYRLNNNKYFLIWDKVYKEYSLSKNKNITIKSLENDIENYNFTARGSIDSLDLVVKNIYL